MKKHLIVFIAYEQYHIIKSSFESISKMENADFFIVENRSVNSDAIKNYFMDKNLVGYIQFNQNIANSAITIFLKNYSSLLREYQYVTITDGDLYVDNINIVFEEIFDAFKNAEVIVSSADLWQGNNHENAIRLPFEKYIDDFNQNDRQFGSIEGNTGGFLITVQNKDSGILNMDLFVDSYLSHAVNNAKRRWFKTHKNLCYHLTWDLYIEGHPYFEWKKQVFNTIWFNYQHSDYQVIK